VSFDVQLSRSAARYLEHLPRPVQQRVADRLRQLATDPFGSYTKPLEGPGDRRAARVGDWRIVFTVDQDARRVNVSAIAPRGQVYRGLT
jgi:mRNA interferase RelE/StbE